jgi:hypothetical protein
MQTSHSLCIGQSTDSTAVKLLPAAAEFVRAEKQLAVTFGIALAVAGQAHDRAPSRPRPLRARDIVLAPAFSSPAPRTFCADHGEPVPYQGRGLPRVECVPFSLHVCHFYSNRGQLVGALVRGTSRQVCQ